MQKKTKTKAEIGLHKKNNRLARMAQETGWLDHYEKLKREYTYINDRGKKSKLTWQQAAYVAWCSAPKKFRLPKTKDEMAIELKYKTRVTMWNWEQKDWFKELLTETQEELFLSHWAEVRHRIVDAALTEVGIAGVSSREQFRDVCREIIEKKSLNEEIDELIELAIERKMSGNNND